MNKTPHEQCAEEIESFIVDNLFVELVSDEKLKLRTILTKHFPQPTPTPSADEIVKKWLLRWKSNKPYYLGDIIKQAILEANAPLTAMHIETSTGEKLNCSAAVAGAYDFLIAKNASLVAEVDRLKLDIANKSPYPVHGCLTGDCAHDNASQCIEAVKEYVSEVEHDNASLLAEVESIANALELTKPNDCTSNPEHKYYSAEYGSCVPSLDRWVAGLRAKLSTADRTGYERGVREAADIVFPDDREYVHETEYEWQNCRNQILNLLNKKD